MESGCDLHGYPFPLCLRLERRENRGKLSSAARRQRELVERLLERGVAALNSLECARGNGVLSLGRPSRVESSLLSRTQSAVLGRLARRAIQMLPKPSPTTEWPGGALRELLKCRDLYSEEQNLATADYDPSKLKILRGETRPKPVERLLDGEVKKWITNPDKFIVKPPEEIAAGPAPVRPHWAREMRTDGAVRRDFVKRLEAVELVSWRVRVKCHIGCFFVRKKDPGQIRLVLDCRPVNQCHRAPPKSRLSTPGALGNLNFSEEWATYCRAAAEIELEHASEKSMLDVLGCDGDAGDNHTRDRVSLVPSAGSVDLKDGFYQFATDEMCEWFGLGVTMAAEEAGITRAWDSSVGAVVDLAPRQRVHATFRGLPMGWSWALHICHSALCQAAREAQAGLGLGSTLVADHQPTPFMHERSALVGPYVDNGNVFAGSAEIGETLLERLIDKLEERGFGVHDIEAVSDNLEVVGKMFDGRARELRPKRVRSWRLWCALGELLTRGRCSGSQMQKITGHLVDHFMVQPELMAIFSSVYRFIEEGTSHQRVLDGNTISELRVAQSLVLFVGADLGRGPCLNAYCSDASTLGYALHVTRCSSAEVLEATRWRERWRFRQPDPEELDIAGAEFGFDADKA
eukprot:4623834-Amphidinium_carterae.1